MVHDLQLRHHRRADRTDLATVLEFGRTDLATVIEFVEVYEPAVLTALVAVSDWPSTSCLPTEREIKPVAKVHSSGVRGQSTPPLIYCK